MWPFKKKRVIDLTEKELKVPKHLKSYSQEYKDLTSSSSVSSLDDASGLGFLSSMARSASEDSPFTDKLSLQNMKVKIEDVEYKINALRSRIDKILDRLDLAEKKIERWERR